MRKSTVLQISVLTMALFIFGRAPQAHAVTRVEVMSFSQIDRAVEQMSSVDPSPFPEYTWVWAPHTFANRNRFEAQLMLDVLRLSNAWNGWINQNSQFIRGFQFKTRLVISDEPFIPLADSIRASNLLEWLTAHVQRNPSLAAHSSDFIKLLPREMFFAQDVILHALASAKVSSAQRESLNRDIDLLIDKAMRPKPRLASTSTEVRRVATDGRVYVTSFAQLDKILNSTRKGIHLIWTREQFSSDEKAQEMLDILRLTEAWDTWFLANGDDVTGLAKRVTFSYVNPTDLLDLKQRTVRLVEWLREHLEANDALASNADFLLGSIPPNLSFATRSLKNMYRKKLEHLDAMMIAELERSSFSLVSENPSGSTSLQRRCETVFFPIKPALRAL